MAGDYVVYQIYIFPSFESLEQRDSDRSIHNQNKNMKQLLEIKQKLRDYFLHVFRKASFGACEIMAH